MKDFYYILGVNSNSSQEEIKSAYRKLSVKFHPDKNGGDIFFTERFKEIQEAYEILSDIAKRHKYNLDRETYTQLKANTSRTNFLPFIESFTANKKKFEYGEEVTFTWKTINSDKVFLKPFGVVTPIGQSSYKIKNFKNASLAFELIAENSNINKQIKAVINLENQTYIDLYDHFKNKFLKENVQEEIKPQQGRKEGENSEIKIKNSSENDSWGFFFILVIIVIIALVINYLVNR